MIKIEDLDEFDGVTADMVRAWLLAKGWERCPALDISCAECWRLGEGAKGTVWLGCTDKRVAKAVEQIARWAGISVQSLLREINPRMRPGWPTDEELERHAFWMVQTLSDDGIRVLGSYVAREWKKAGIKVACWPCDAHGHKVRLATDDKRRG